MKQVTRLKESELRNKIYESVKQVLSELDWKTYHSAGTKALDMDDEERADDFYSKAENGFKKKHNGIELSDVHQKRGSWDDDNYWDAVGDYEDYATGRSQYVKGKGWTKMDEAIRRAIRKVLG